MPTPVGGRVTAIRSANKDTIELLGHGVYEGEHPHPDWGFPNPRIKLDNGEVVWGIECWWGDEAKMKERLAENFPLAETVNVKIDDE